MNINLTENGTELIVALEGRLDTLTSPELEDALEDKLEDIEKLVFDMAKLEYISSAGLRVLLASAHAMDGQGDMVVRNINETVRDVFEVTGFIDILNIE